MNIKPLIEAINNIFDSIYDDSDNFRDKEILDLKLNTVEYIINASLTNDEISNIDMTSLFLIKSILKYIKIEEDEINTLPIITSNMLLLINENE